MTFNTISVVGLGYIGLPTAAMFAAYGKYVIGVDVNESVVETINRGEIHIVEPELDAIVHKAVTDGRLRATLVVEPADAFLIAVPTPFLPIKEGGRQIPEPDLTYIESAACQIAPVLKVGDLVVLESTSPVGATEKLADWLSEKRPDLTFPKTHGESSDIRIAHCPERVLPGHVVRELVENARVIGGITPRCSAVAVELYKTFVEGECVVTNSRTAEMAKLTENASRDVSIAFANELSVICDKLDIDVWELISLANRHPRVNILEPGPGVGGHCIAVDPWFIVHSARELSQLIHTARKVNDAKPTWVVEKAKLAVSNLMQKKTSLCASDVAIAVFGLAFKANIDDLRESPAVEIVKQLSKELAGTIYIVEPNINTLPGVFGSNCELVDIDFASENADIAVILVNHKEFDCLSLKNCDSTEVVDTKGIWVR